MSHTKGATHVTKFRSSEKLTTRYPRQSVSNNIVLATDVAYFKVKLGQKFKPPDIAAMHSSRRMQISKGGMIS